MKKLLLSVAMAAVAPLAWAQISSTETTTTTTTDGGGTIYVTKSGKDLDEEVVKTRIKVGVRCTCTTVAKATTCSSIAWFWTKIELTAL